LTEALQADNATNSGPVPSPPLGAEAQNTAHGLNRYREWIGYSRLEYLDMVKGRDKKVDASDLVSFAEDCSANASDPHRCVY
jgi:hypothetical protein